MRHNIDSGSDEPYAHTPVMWREVLDQARAVADIGGDVFVDCTLGEGGHSEMLLREFPRLTVVGFERDEEILAVCEGRLAPYKNRVRPIRDNFANIREHLDEYRGRICGFLYDFGISSYHFDRSGRGFSFRGDEPLDMRLDRRTARDARYVVNNYSENELTDIFFRYGEERWARKIARSICERRTRTAIETAADLAELVLRAIPKRYHVRNVHPATRIFQALRIEVNDELSAIGKSLRDAAGFLMPGGRIAAISFHSLEDRIVKNTFRRMASGCSCELEPQHCRCTGKPLVAIVTKKPVLPGDDEIALNKRSRSAKMRVCEKIQGANAS